MSLAVFIGVLRRYAANTPKTQLEAVIGLPHLVGYGAAE
jgi:hypothetical protein